MFRAVLPVDAGYGRQCFACINSSGPLRMQCVRIWKRHIFRNISAANYNTPDLKTQDFLLSVIERVFPCRGRLPRRAGESQVYEAGR